MEEDTRLEIIPLLVPVVVVQVEEMIVSAETVEDPDKLTISQTLLVVLAEVEEG